MGDYVPDVVGLQVEHLLTAEGEELPRQIARTRRGQLDLLHPPRDLLGEHLVEENELRIPEYGGE
jgi:hypothetical protein